MTITVIDVMRQMGILNPHKSLTWPVGQMVRLQYEVDTGIVPPKDNRTKTNDPNSVHCFALYPEDYYNQIESIVNLFVHRRYRYNGGLCSVAQLAAIRGCSVRIMQDRLRVYSIPFAVGQ